MPWEAWILVGWLVIAIALQPWAVGRPRPILGAAAVSFGVAMTLVQLWLVLRLAEVL